MENGEGEREIYCTWERKREVWTRWRRGRLVGLLRSGSELRWGVVLQTRTIFLDLVQSSNTDCGAIELAHWGWGGKWKWEEVERGKWEERNFWGKKFRRTEVLYQVSAPTVITMLSADGTMHWSKGPLRQPIYGTATESWMIRFENKWNLFSVLGFITQFFEW